MSLIECGDGRYAPAVMVCVHLLEGESEEWCAVPSGDLEVEHDWLCSECYGRFESLGVDEMQLVCMHCANEMREQAGLRAKSRCLLYCLGALEEMGEAGVAQGRGLIRISESGMSMYRELVESGYEPEATEMLECLTKVAGAEEAARQFIRVIDKLKGEGTRK